MGQILCIYVWCNIALLSQGIFMWLHGTSFYCAEIRDYGKEWSKAGYIHLHFFFSFSWQAKHKKKWTGSPIHTRDSSASRINRSVLQPLGCSGWSYDSFPTIPFNISQSTDQLQLNRMTTHRSKFGWLLMNWLNFDPCVPTLRAHQEPVLSSCSSNAITCSDKATR